MHLLVTDRLACVRCGPGFGLILLADELEERRVLRGALGCPNCRERYPVEEGFGDLRASPREEEESPEPPGGDDPEGALRLAALLGVREGPGLLLLSGSSVRHAERIAAMIQEIEVVAAHPELRNDPEVAGVTRISMGERLPFQSRTLRGLVLSGEKGRRRVPEGIRVLEPGGRLVLLDPPSGSREIMEEGGLDLLLEADKALVGSSK